MSLQALGASQALFQEELRESFETIKVSIRTEIQSVIRSVSTELAYTHGKRDGLLSSSGQNTQIPYTNLDATISLGEENDPFVHSRDNLNTSSTSPNENQDSLSVRFYEIT